MAEAQKKTVMAKIEFGVFNEAAIEVILEMTKRATKKFGGCECFDVWSVEVDGDARDPDDPKKSLW
jgi:hypothetical protein